MSRDLDEIYEEALSLSDESKAVLAERIHLHTVKRRRDQMKNGIVEPVDGSEASVLAHRIIEK